MHLTRRANHWHDGNLTQFARCIRPCSGHREHRRAQLPARHRGIGDRFHETNRFQPRAWSSRSLSRSCGGGWGGGATRGLPTFPPPHPPKHRRRRKPLATAYAAFPHPNPPPQEREREREDHARGWKRQVSRNRYPMTCGPAPRRSAGWPRSAPRWRRR